MRKILTAGLIIYIGCILYATNKEYHWFDTEMEKIFKKEDD